MSVKVAGLLNAVKIDFDDVLVSADDQYHIIQSAYRVRTVSASFLDMIIERNKGVGQPYYQPV